MANVTILNEKPITMAEVKEELEKIKKESGELNYRANKTHDYLQEFSKENFQKAKSLIKKIEDLNIPRLKEEHIVKIIDTMPKFAEEVKALLSGYTITISQENCKKIAEAVKEAI
jgi:DNA-directed RNA polymerase subunit F